MWTRTDLKERRTERVTLSMTRTEKGQLIAKAKEAGFDSVSAYLRHRTLGPQEPELDALVDLARESAQRATKAVNRAVEAVNRSVAESGQCVQAARDGAMQEWRSWTQEQQFAVRKIFVADQ